MREKLATIVLCFFCLFISVSTPLSTAQTSLIDDEGSIVIQPGKYAYYFFKEERGYELHYNFTVIEGPPIDVLIVWERDMAKLQAGEKYNRYDPRSSTTGGEYSFWIFDDDGYYLIFYNTNEETASLDGTTNNVTIRYSIEIVEGPYFQTEDFVFFGAVALIMCAIITYSLLKKRKNACAPLKQSQSCKDVTVLDRLKYAHRVSKELREETFSGIHRFIYAGCVVSAILGLSILLTGIFIGNRSMIYFLSLPIILLFYEETRYAIAEWRRRRFITHTLNLGIIYPFIFAPIYYNPNYVSYFSDVWGTVMICLLVLNIFKPFDVIRVKDEEVRKHPSFLDR